LFDGFTSRIVATSGKPVQPGVIDYVWHRDPDGGTCFATDDGGWIYVSNCEAAATGKGGVSALRFRADGVRVDAYSILSGTTRNCSGGAMPWGTWLSCEERPRGLVYECDPYGKKPAQLRAGMGAFNHEAAAADPVSRAVYLTEDEPDGAFYRFVPTTWTDLSAGRLEVLTRVAGDLVWTTVPDPTFAGATPLRQQVANTIPFAGAEGICRLGGALLFTTKYDNVIHRYDPVANELSVSYDAGPTTDVLSGVDAIAAFGKDVYVAEDGGDMQVVRVTPAGKAEAVVQITGAAAVNSEVTGVAFSPDGRRLYCNSQRTPGTTYEITGPW
jgi:hypothetical protein